MERLINKICNTRCAGRLRGKAKHFLMSQLFRKAMFKSSLSKIQRSTPPTSFQFFQIKKPVCKVWKRKKQVNELAGQVQTILYHSALHIFMASANSNSNTNPINVDVHTQQATGNRQQATGRWRVKSKASFIANITWRHVSLIPLRPSSIPASLIGSWIFYFRS